MSDWHVTLRHLVDRLLIGGIALLAFFAFMHRVAPPPAPVHGPVAVFSPSPLEHEVGALEHAQSALAQQMAGVVSALQRPGATVIHDVVPAIPVSTASHLLEATRPDTVEKVALSVVGPSPMPTPGTQFFAHVYDAAYAADAHAIHDTTVNVNITRQEVAPSRLGSAFTSGGDGLDFTVWQRKQFALNLAAIIRGSHLAPAICAQYLIPHTRLEGGPCLLSTGGALHVGIGASEKF